MKEASAPQKESKSSFRVGKNQGAFFQPRLVVGPSDDVHEREADSMAEKVMRMPAADTGHEQFFSPRPVPSPVILHRKCGCQEEEKVQRKEEQEEGTMTAQEGHSHQQSMAGGGGDDLPVQNNNNLGSPYFIAQCKAIENINRKCAQCEEENKLQRKEENTGSSSSEAPPIVSDALRTGGQSMDASTQEFMEGRFGYDFSGVKIHTGHVAAKSAQSINALAYTSGSSIVFNEGQYATGTESGRKLLAHELTHVVQQNPSLQKKAKPGKINAGSAAGNVVQRYLTFAPDPRPKGTLIHSAVLPMFAGSNTDLFIEVRIPGANKKDIDKGVTGVADFYKATDQQRTIGITFDNEPGFLTKNNKLEGGGKGYSHNAQAAPTGGIHTPRVRRLDVAPEAIQIGDLKPGGSAEVTLGIGQVQDYMSGITRTAADINSYLLKNPKEHDGKIKSAWNPKPKDMSSLTIPDKLNYPTGSGISRDKLSLYGGDSKKPIEKDTNLVGSMYVYKENNGIWSYEWIPDNVDTATGSGKVNQVLHRLNHEVIPSIEAANSGTVAPKRMPSAPLPVKPAPVQQKKVQKKDDKFKAAEWEKEKYNPWQEEAKTFLGNDKEVGKAQVAEGVVEVSKRTGNKLKVPDEVRERGKGLGKIKHWKTFGKTYGFLREKFNFIYVKIKGVVDKVKEKVKKLSKSSAGTAFGNWVKAVAKVIFKIFKLVGSWVIHQTVDKLVTSLKEGITGNINKLINKLVPEEAEKKLAEFEAKKEEYQRIIEQKEEEITTFLFGDKIDLFDALEKWESIANTVSTVVDVVKWGIRIIACASPPALGCLWNLAVSAIEYLFSKLIQTCWFTKKAINPVMENVNMVKEFPTKLATGIVEAANKYIPLPGGMDPLFAPIPAPDASQHNFDCGESGDGGSGEVSGDREAILNLAQEIGDEKMLAFVAMATKKGAGPWVLLTKDRIDLLKEGLKKVSVDDLKKITQEPDAKAPVELEEFMKDIKAYTPKEKTVIKEWNDKLAGEKEAGKKGDTAGGDQGKGGKGKDDSGQKYNEPLYGPPPGKTTGTIATVFATGIEGAEIKSPADRKDPINIVLRVDILDNGAYYKVILPVIKVKVARVDDTFVYLENQVEFSTYYTDSDFIVIEKGKILKVNKKDILYY